METGSLDNSEAFPDLFSMNPKVTMITIGPDLC